MTRVPALLLLAALLARAGEAPAADPPPIPPAAREAAPVKAKAPAHRKADPAPAIDGPAEATYLLTFTVAGVSPAAKVAWDWSPDDKGAQVKEGKADRSLSLAGPAGTYRVTAFVADAGNVYILKRTARLTGGKSPGPDPDDDDPTPRPDGALGLRKVSREAARKVPAAARAADGAKLASANRSTASATAAGAAVKDGRFDAQTALELWREGNRTAVADKAAWEAWGAAASAGMQAAYKGGKLGATAAGWAAAFNELADGLADAGGN